MWKGRKSSPRVCSSDILIRARDGEVVHPLNYLSKDMPDLQICVVLLEELRVSHNLPEVTGHLLSGNFLFPIQYFSPVSKV